MKIKLISSRSGGPFVWAKIMKKNLDKIGIKTTHSHTTLGIIKSNIFCKEDIIHTTVPFFFKKTSKPHILTIHGNFLCEKKHKIFFKKTIANAKYITVPSFFLKKKLKLKKAKVIPNFVMSQNYKKAKHSNKKRIKIVTITNFHYKKKSEGIIYLVKILQKAAKKVDKFKVSIVLDIVGGGKFLGKVKNQVRMIKNEKNVKTNFLGNVHNASKRLSKYDIFAYYSFLDNFPIVILEAMASGLPVITNNIGAVGEIIRKKREGFVEENNLEYSKDIEELILSAKTRKAVGSSALRKVEKDFDIKKILPIFIKIYKKVFTE